MLFNEMITQVMYKNRSISIILIVSARNISNLISQLKCDKAAGSDDLCAEYLKFAHDKLHTLLYYVFYVVYYPLLSASIND